ncbi:MAG TPA: tetratricopeptide repeat protein [Verrucomicrobiae bacterium]|jgi:tetratricopeptide (TPR) repeat protein|nr:tetratricopeptide repeat protein [Verrucomicrobiae bacterium]
MQTLLRILFLVFFSFTATACIWDAQSLWREKLRNHDLAQTILHNEAIPENTNDLRATIKSLEADRHENDSMWWNNLAGAYIRLGQSGTAVKLLEPVAGKFRDDYGIHANLGTAYHLLGRYQDAEREIARDLEINPNAHFGLEKYHLALLQYLVRDTKYRARHVYVDECTAGFLADSSGPILFSQAEELDQVLAVEYTNDVAAAEAEHRLGIVAAIDTPPVYRAKWNLLTDKNFEAGVIYMAQMNPEEPACWTMLGLAAWNKHNYHLAATAFEKAIDLKSPQSDLLQKRVDGLHEYINKSHLTDPTIILIIFCLAPVVILYYIYSKIRDRYKLKMRRLA